MVSKIIDPNFNIKTFNVKCDNELSSLAKVVLKSFKFKLYYYVIDDLLYLLKSNPDERDYLLQILNSSVIFLQNNLYVNFFDIYIYDININEISKFNRFVNEQSESFKFSNTNDYVEFEEVFTVFEKSVLDLMESEFLNFSQPSSKFTNTFITASSNNIGLETFGVENTQNDKFRNFQLLFRDLMSVPLPKSTGQQMILDMVDSQYSLCMSKIQNLMNYDIALKDKNNLRRKILYEKQKKDPEFVAYRRAIAKKHYDIKNNDEEWRKKENERIRLSL